MFRSSACSTVNGVKTRTEGAVLERGTAALTIDSTVLSAVARVRLRLAPEDALQLAVLTEKRLVLEFSGTFVTQKLDTVADIPVRTGFAKFRNGTAMRTAIVRGSDSTSMLQLEF